MISAPRRSAAPLSTRASASSAPPVIARPAITITSSQSSKPPANASQVAPAAACAFSCDGRSCAGDHPGHEG